MAHRVRPNPECPPFDPPFAPALNIVFAGTPGFAVPALARLHASRHRVVAVYTQPDRPFGRGRQVQPGPVKAFALAHGLSVEQPATLRDPAAAMTLASYAPDVMVVVAYGLLLPKEILAVPRFGCLNIHASLLPRWRGAAPIQRAVLAGDRETGVGIMQMEAGLDTGPVLVERVLPIDGRDTTGSLHDKLAVLGAEALLVALEGVESGSLVARPQAAEGVTYASKIRKEEALIDWSRPASAIDAQVRAFNPVPGAETRWRGEQLKVWEAEPVIAAPAPPGTVLTAAGNDLVVATGDGALRLTRVQLAGRKPLPASDFLRAQSLAGERLG